MKPNKDRVITVQFNADTGAFMKWNFRPQQSEVKVFAGETALAFFTAKNPTSKPIDGISTYNVLPFEAGQVCIILGSIDDMVLMIFFLFFLVLYQDSMFLL